MPSPVNEKGKIQATREKGGEKRGAPLSSEGGKSTAGG